MKMTRKELLEIRNVIQMRLDTITDFPQHQKDEDGYQKEVGLISNVMEKIQTALDEGRD